VYISYILFLENIHMIKPGYRTSEFWFTLVSFIFSGLYLTGVINDTAQKDELISSVSHAVESIILISGQALILYKYIKGRNEVKKFVETEKIAEIEKEIVQNDNKRNNSRTGRQGKSTSKRVSKRSKKNSSK
jgi:hypothetical protein